MAESYPMYPRPSCQALVHDNHRILLIQRGTPPFKGLWSLPGGSLKIGETLETAVVREVKEESGLVISVARYLGYRDAIEWDSEGRARFHFVIHYFLGQVDSGQLCAGDDAVGVEWVSISALARRDVTDGVMWSLTAAGLAPKRGLDPLTSD